MKRYHHQYKSSRGFTLLEVLVVIVIIAVLSGFVGLSISSDSNRQLQEEARRLIALIDLASQESILNAQEIVLDVQENSYAFLIKGDEGEFVAVDESGALRPRQLPENMSLRLTLENLPYEKDSFVDPFSDEEEEGQTQNYVFILSSGEMSPFTLDITLDDERSYTIEGDLMGGLKLIEPEAES